MAPEASSTTTPAQKGGKAKSAGETRVLQTRSAKAGLAVSARDVMWYWAFGYSDWEMRGWSSQEPGAGLNMERVEGMKLG